MVVCNYFQQGYCRFGQSCRFEHAYSSKYTYRANPSPAQPAQSGVTTEQLIQQVDTDVQSVLKGGQWILSSYAPFKEKPAFPGLTDQSPEEIRLMIYEAKAENRLDQTISLINSLTKDAEYKYRQLLQPNANVIKVLESLFRGELPQSPFTTSPQTGSVFGGSTNAPSSASSIFASAIQNSTPSVFGGNTAPSNASAIFGGQNNASNPEQNMFGVQESQPKNPQSIFAQANQSIFQSPQPTAQPVNPSSLFSGAAQNFFGSTSQQGFGTPSSQAFGSTNQPNVFQSTPAPISGTVPTDVFQKSVFEQPAPPSNVFGQAPRSGVFGQGNSEDSGVYSKLTELSSDDVEAFNCSDFKLGFIPELPPAYSLCF